MEGYYAINDNLANDFNKVKLSFDDATILNFCWMIFDHKRPIYYRDNDGNLYACRGAYAQDRVMINPDLLPCIPRGKYIDIREVVRKNQKDEPITNVGG